MSAVLMASLAIATASSAVVLAASASARALSLALMARSSSRVDISATFFTSPPSTTWAAAMKSSRSSAGMASRASALLAPKSASVCGFDHSRASRIKFCAARSDRSTRSDSHALASSSRWPMPRMDSPAVFLRSTISAVMTSMSRPSFGVSTPVKSTIQHLLT